MNLNDIIDTANLDQTQVEVLLKAVNEVIANLPMWEESLNHRMDDEAEKIGNMKDNDNPDLDDKNNDDHNDNDDVVFRSNKPRNSAYRYRCLKREKSLYGKNRKERRQGRKEYYGILQSKRDYRLYNRDLFRGDIAERKLNAKERFAKEDANRPTEPRYTGWTYTEDNPYYYNESYNLMEQDGILLFREYFDGTIGRATEEDYATVYGYGGREMISDPLTTKIGDKFHFVQKWEVK